MERTREPVWDSKEAKHPWAYWIDDATGDDAMAATASNS